MVVADDREDVVEYGQARALVGGHVAADLGHERLDGERLEGDRLAARVRPGDDEQRAVGTELEIHRDDRAARVLPALSEQERVAGAPERDRPSGVDRRGRRAHALGGLGSRKDPIELADRAHQAVQIVEARVDGGGQLGQDAGGLVLFLARGLHEIVVGLDDLLGLDEERLAALGAVVDDAAHAGPGLGPHRQDVAAVSKRDVPVGEEPVGVVALEGALELGGELPAPFADLAAEALERGAGVIRHGAARVEGAAEPVGELGEAGQGVGDRRHARARLAHAPTVGAELGARVEDRDDLDHLGAVEHAAIGATARQDGSDVGEGFQGERAGGGERQASLAGHLDRRLDFGGFGERLGCRRPITSHLRRSFVGQKTPHRVPFGAGLPDPACLQPAPHSLPIRVTGVPASIERPWLIGHPFAPLGLLAGREGFALATNAGLFIVLTLLELGEEAGLLALLLEALERAFEGFVGLDDDLGHTTPPQNGRISG